MISDSDRNAEKVIDVQSGAEYTTERITVSPEFVLNSNMYQDESGGWHAWISYLDKWLDLPSVPSSEELKQSTLENVSRWMSGELQVDEKSRFTLRTLPEQFTFLEEIEVYSKNQAILLGVLQEGSFPIVVVGFESSAGERFYAAVRTADSVFSSMMLTPSRTNELLNRSRNSEIYIDQQSALPWYVWAINMPGLFIIDYSIYDGQNEVLPVIEPYLDNGKRLTSILAFTKENPLTQYSNDPLINPNLEALTDENLVVGGLVRLWIPSLP